MSPNTRLLYNSGKQESMTIRRLIPVSIVHIRVIGRLQSIDLLIYCVWNGLWRRKHCRAGIRIVKVCCF